MNATNALVIGLVAGAVAGGASGFLVTTSLSGSHAEGPPPIQSPATANVDAGALRGELAALESRIADLEVRGPVAAPQRASAERPEDLSELRELAAALSSPTSATPPKIAALVDRALEERQAQEDAEREARREQAALDGIDRRLEKLGPELGLDARQTKGMRDALLAYDQRRSEMFDSMRNNGPAGFDRESVRTTMDTMRSEHDARLQTILTPTQFDLYKQSSDDRPSFGRGGGFGGFDAGGRGNRGGGPGGGGGGN